MSAVIGVLLVLAVVWAAVRILGNGKVDAAGVVFAVIVVAVALAYFGRGRL